MNEQTLIAVIGISLPIVAAIARMVFMLAKYTQNQNIQDIKLGNNIKELDLKIESMGRSLVSSLTIIEDKTKRIEKDVYKYGEEIQKFKIDTAAFYASNPEIKRANN